MIVSTAAGPNSNIFSTVSVFIVPCQRTCTGELESVIPAINTRLYMQPDQRDNCGYLRFNRRIGKNEFMPLIDIRIHIQHRSLTVSTMEPTDTTKPAYPLTPTPSTYMVSQEYFEELERQLANMKASIVLMDKENTELKASNNNLVADRKRYEDIIDDLHDDISDLHGEVSVAKARLSDMQSDMAASELHYRDKDMQMMQLRTERDNFDTCCRDWQVKYDRREIMIKSLQQELEDVLPKLGAAQAASDNANINKQHHKREIDQYMSDLRIRDDKIAELEAKTTHQEEKISAMDKAVYEMHEELAQRGNNETYGELKIRYERLDAVRNQEMIAYINDRNDRKKELLTRTNEITELKAIVDSQTEKIAAKDRSISDLYTELEHCVNVKSFDDLKVEYGKLEAANVKLTTERDELQDLSNRLQTNYTSKNNEYNEMFDELKRYKTAVATRDTHIESLHAANNQHHKTNKELQLKCVDLQDAYTRRSADWNECLITITKLSGDLEKTKQHRCDKSAYDPVEALMGSRAANKILLETVQRLNSVIEGVILPTKKDDV
jgi:chromosome segregation ATPase